jgi:tRNA(fMet)-specific endonuclease VapC
MSVQAPTEINLCSVVLSELIYGAVRASNQAAQLALVAKFAATFNCLPLDTAAAEVHARLRADLAGRGTPIGPYDSQIAAIALAHNLILVTHDTAEFSRVPGLQLEDWHT